MARSTASSNPLLAVVGATGTGKSELAVALARRFNGEIINGDAMQLYAGLPVITNKIPLQDQQGIPHHLLGCIELKEQTWVVGTFVQKALDIIEEIRARGKLPILVGGTHYYTQALLFQDRLVEDAKPQHDHGPKHEMLDLPTEDLLKELERVDPVMAQRWHPNDRRKIQRSLEIYLKTGKRASEIYAEQKLQDDASNECAMRFSTLLFWVHSETEALRTRLDARVETMMDHGLINEVQTLRNFAAAQQAEDSGVDETSGIWVSIGYKEFKDYAAALEDGNTDQKRLLTLRLQALERTQAATRQYAKRQVRWIRIKLLNALIDADVEDRLFLLDGSDVSKFESIVVDRATQITQAFLDAEPLPSPPSLSTLAAECLRPLRDYDLSSVPEKWGKKFCEVCGVTCMTAEQWERHIKSKAHRKLASKNRQNDVGQRDQVHGPCRPAD